MVHRIAIVRALNVGIVQLRVSSPTMVDQVVVVVVVVVDHVVRSAWDQHSLDLFPFPVELYH